jgi:hypothetical protein
MIVRFSTCRGDEQLECGLYETANWTVNGVQSVVLCEVASLHLAIEKAAQFAAMGREVVALKRKHPPEIVVTPGQVRRLTNLLARSQPHVSVLINNKVDGFNRDLPGLMPNGAVHRETTVSANS